MGRPRATHRCTDCAHVANRWLGRCPGCGAWGTLELTAPPTAMPVDGAAATSTELSAVPLSLVTRMPTGIGELDRVLGGGLVPGSVVLLGGEPGVGKSTLALQAASALARAGRRVVYAAAEEAPVQVRLRAERLGALVAGLSVTDDARVPALVGLLHAESPDVLVVDSIQAVADPSVGGAPGSVAQVRACAAAIVAAARSQRVATVLVGHVTKEGALAGPRALEHLVDAVLSFEGDRDRALRVLRGRKNRFGSAGEVGCFEMTPEGLAPVADPSRLALSRLGRPPATGVATTITLAGPRPLAVEVQALVSATGAPVPRRQATGVDPTRLALLVAVVERRAGVPVGNRDLFATAAGGVRLREPAADLAIALAVASSRLDAPLTADTIVIGEVDLVGDVRTVPQLRERLAEAARLGFRRALVPAEGTPPWTDLELVPVDDLRHALAMGLARAGTTRRGRFTDGHPTAMSATPTIAHATPTV